MSLVNYNVLFFIYYQVTANNSAGPGAASESVPFNTFGELLFIIIIVSG